MASDQRCSEQSAQVDPPPHGFSFSTDLLPERDRVPFFKDELSKLLTCDVEILDDKPRHAMSFLQAGPVALGSVQVSPSRAIRTRNHVKDCSDDFLFVLHSAGWQEITHNGRNVRLNVGDACLVQSARPAETVYPEGGSTFSMRLDGTALRALIRQPEHMTGHFISRDRPGFGLLRGYLRSFSEAKDTLSPGLYHTFGLHVVDLVAAILGAGGDGLAQAEAGGVKAARLRAVLESIATRACDPSFSIAATGMELDISARHIQRLLEETGESFSEHLREERLRRAWRLLADPQSRDRKIATIAYDCGFNDLSHFNRAFRRRFGESPTAARTSGVRSHH